MKIIVQTPNDQFHIRSYFDCSRREAIHKVRETDFDKKLGLQFDQPPPQKKRRDSSHERELGGTGPSIRFQHLE